MRKTSKVVLMSALSVVFFAGINGKAFAYSDDVTIQAGTEIYLDGKQLFVQNSSGETVTGVTLNNEKAYYSDTEKMLYTNDDTRYVDFDSTYTYFASSNTQAYTSTSKSKPLTALNNKGKKVGVQIIKNTKLSKFNNSWYKGVVKYTDYKKVGKKLISQSKSAIVYIPSSQIKVQTDWKKYVKTVSYQYDVSFKPFYREGATLEEYNQIQVGMSLKQVQDIFGMEGVLEYNYSYTDSDGTTTTNEYYSFNAPWGYGNASIDFENGFVTFKSQSNLN